MWGIWRRPNKILPFIGSFSQALAKDQLLTSWHSNTPVSDPYREKRKRQAKAASGRGERINALFPFSLSLIITRNPSTPTGTVFSKLIGFYWKFVLRTKNLKVSPMKFKVGYGYNQM